MVEKKSLRDQLWATLVSTKHEILFLKFHYTGFYWLVVSTPLKNISQIGHLPQVGVKIKQYLKPPPSLVGIQYPYNGIILETLHKWIVVHPPQKKQTTTRGLSFFTALA